VVADHTKWGTVGLSSFAALEQIDTLVTDAGLPTEARAEVSEHLRRLVVAGEPGNGTHDTDGADN
jgi:DeoR/GlpR family transcriptional regulator of sugar metabolism